MLPIKKILNECLADVPDAVGAIFLDHEGESVEFETRGCSPHDAKVIGAYAGIFLSQVERIARELALGSTSRLKVDFQHVSVLTALLQDGYYLVLVLREDALEARAWRSMERTRERLLAEM